jgi:hypothetical protein
VSQTRKRRVFPFTAIVGQEEMKLALQECGRKLGQYVRRRQRMKREGEKRDVFERYIGEIAKACHALTGTDTEELYDALLRQAQRRTEIADAVLDEDGKFIKDDHGRLAKQDDVIIVDHLAGTPNASDPEGPDREDDDLDRPASTTEPKPKPKPAKSGPKADAGGERTKAGTKKVVTKAVRKGRGSDAAGLFMDGSGS